MPLIDVRGRKVHVQELGSSGPRVVLIHPLGDSLSAWFFTAAPMLARSFRVLLYDLRGHGFTQFDRTGYDTVTLAGDLSDLLGEWAGSEPVRVGGHSSGGTLALRFGVDHPERVHSLGIVDAPMPPYQVRDNPVLGDMAPEEALARFPTEEREVRRGKRRRDLAINRKVRLRNETTFTDDFELEPGFMDRLERIDRPTFLLYGTRSPFLSVGEELSRIIPGARLEVVEGGHLLPIERRRLVAERLGGFFA